MDDSDSPWKEALELYFSAFLLLLYPHIHAAIDWSRPVEWLDKELQQLRPRAARGRRTVDKLAKVWRWDGTPGYVLIHIEVQAQRDNALPERVCVYNCRLYDAFGFDVASLVVLADASPRWRPRRFRRGLWGTRLSLAFEPVKLLDFETREAELEASTNPFAHFVLAYLKALRTKDDDPARATWKVRLVRNLYERGFGADDVRQLFRLIDWVMTLPAPLDDVVWRDVRAFEESKKMPYLTYPERKARDEAFLHLIGGTLRARFGDEGEALLPSIQALEDPEKYLAVNVALTTATTLDEVRQAIAAATPPPKKKKGKAKKSDA